MQHQRQSNKQITTMNNELEEVKEQLRLEKKESRKKDKKINKLEAKIVEIQSNFEEKIAEMQLNFETRIKKLENDFEWRIRQNDLKLEETMKIFKEPDTLTLKNKAAIHAMKVIFRMWKKDREDKAKKRVKFETICEYLPNSSFAQMNSLPGPPKPIDQEIDLPEYHTEKKQKRTQKTQQRPLNSLELSNGPSFKDGHDDQEFTNKFLVSDD